MRVVRDESLFSDILVTIHEGRNRQVRRMFKAVKNPVLELKRIAIGPLRLKGIKVGEYRYLQDAELKQLGQRLGLHLSGNQA